MASDFLHEGVPVDLVEELFNRARRERQGDAVRSGYPPGGDEILRHWRILQSERSSELQATYKERIGERSADDEMARIRAFQESERKRMEADRAWRQAAGDEIDALAEMPRLPSSTRRPDSGFATAGSILGLIVGNAIDAADAGTPALPAAPGAPAVARGSYPQAVPPRPAMRHMSGADKIAELREQARRGELPADIAAALLAPREESGPVHGALVPSPEPELWLASMEEAGGIEGMVADE